MHPRAYIRERRRGMSYRRTCKAARDTKQTHTQIHGHTRTYTDIHGYLADPRRGLFELQALEQEARRVEDVLRPVRREGLLDVSVYGVVCVVKVRLGRVFLCSSVPPSSVPSVPPPLGLPTHAAHRNTRSRHTQHTVPFSRGLLSCPSPPTPPLFQLTSSGQQEHILRCISECAASASFIVSYTRVYAVPHKRACTHAVHASI